MVGIAVGLFVVAAASLVVSSQLNDNRRLLLELQVQQDLRATADIITRELRRAGRSAAAEQSVANLGLTPPVKAAPNTFLTLGVAASPGAVTYTYKRENSDQGPFGFRLDTDGVIRSRLTGQSGWQELTDINTLFVDTFTVAETDSQPVRLPCPKDCPVGTGDTCWPLVTVREFAITISGHAPGDGAIRRTVTTQVRLRNDQVQFFSGALGDAACPA